MLGFEEMEIDGIGVVVVGFVDIDVGVVLLESVGDVLVVVVVKVEVEVGGVFMLIVGSFWDCVWMLLVNIGVC